MLRTLTIERSNDYLCLLCRFVHGSIGEISDFFGMTYCPCEVGFITSMAGIARCCRISTSKRGCHIHEIDRARSPIVSDPLNLPFQPTVGIQTAKLISESRVGSMYHSTRQNAGRLWTRLLSDNVKGPAG